MVGRGSAYDLFLSRELKNAQVVHAASSQAVVQDFLQGGAEVAAGVRQQLEMDTRDVPSGSTRTSAAGTGSAPAIRSNPKFPA